MTELEFEKEVKDAVKHFHWLFTVESVMRRCGFPEQRREGVEKILKQMIEEGKLYLWDKTYSKM
jgi:hypothetical protein